MIITPREDGLTKVWEDDGNVIIQHVTDHTAILEQAKFLRDNTDRGFTADRQMQCIGYIPFDLWISEGLHKMPMEEAVRFLESSEKMKPYRVSERNTGHDGRIIIK